MKMNKIRHVAESEVKEMAESHAEFVGNTK